MRDVIEAELAFSRSIIADGYELVPRFRISKPDGDVTIFVQLPDDIEECNKRVQLIAS